MSESKEEENVVNTSEDVKSEVNTADAVKSEVNTAEGVKSEANTSLDVKEWITENYNPEEFEEESKRYEEELKILSQMRFKSPDDQFVFDRLPILPNQKLMMIYQLIVEDSDCIECDEDLKRMIKSIINPKTE